MNKPRLTRGVVLTGAVFLLIVGACGLSLRSERRQEALNRQLIAALVKGNMQQALVLVNAGADPNTPYKVRSRPSLQQMWNLWLYRSKNPPNDSPTAFLIACGAPWSQGDYNWQMEGPDASRLVQAMLDHGAKLEARDQDGLASLMYAAYNNHKETVRVLIEHGANVNARDNDGSTPLQYSVNYPAIVRTLLDHGASANLAANDGTTPLILAAGRAKLDSVVLLLEHGAEVNAKDKDGETALMQAAYYSGTPVCRLLLDHGAQVNAMKANGETALYGAILGTDSWHYENYTNPIPLLLKRGADPNLTAKDGTTVLQLAQRWKTRSVVALLKQAGAKK
jgi:hypothetical protein